MRRKQPPVATVSEKAYIHTVEANQVENQTILPDKPFNPKKILVVKLCCIGDVVFITPMLRALKTAYPEARLYYLAVPWVKDIVDQIKYVDEVILYETPLSELSPLSKGMETLDLLTKLRALHIDVMITGHRNKLFGMLGKMAGIPMRIGFTNQGNSLLTHPIRFDPQQYEMERYLELLSPLKIPSAGLKTEINPLPEEVDKVTAKLSDYGIETNEKLAGIFAGGGENPGTTMTIKRWQPEKYAQLTHKIFERFPGKILLLGGPSDYQLNESIKQQSQIMRERIINVARDFSLRSVPALMKRCSIVIGGDSGPTHIAAAVGTRTVYLFGPSDPRLVAPRNPDSVYIWKQVSCSPCYTPETVLQKKYFQGKNFICWTGTNECMTTITVEDVYVAIQRFF